jgi:hypothetical protein
MAGVVAPGWRSITGGLVGSGAQPLSVAISKVSSDASSKAGINADSKVDGDADRGPDGGRQSGAGIIDSLAICGMASTGVWRMAEGMWILFLEAGLALGLFVFIVWWTLPRRGAPGTAAEVAIEDKAANQERNQQRNQQRDPNHG